MCPHHALLCQRVLRAVHALSRGYAVGWRGFATRLAEGEGRPGDIELLAEVANGIAGNSICALGDAAAWPCWVSSPSSAPTRSSAAQGGQAS